MRRAFFVERRWSEPAQRDPPWVRASSGLRGLKDHFGSVQAELGFAKTVITDEAGAVLERPSFDAWGQRREVSWTAYLPPQGYAWQGKPITRG